MTGRGVGEQPEDLVRAGGDQVPAATTIVGTITSVPTADATGGTRASHELADGRTPLAAAAG